MYIISPSYVGVIQKWMFQEFICNHLESKTWKSFLLWEERWGRCLYLLSSLYHWNSAEGTAEASHCSVPFCPTGTPVPLASEMYGGSVERICPIAFKKHSEMNWAATFTDFIFYSLLYLCLLKLTCRSLYKLCQRMTPVSVIQKKSLVFLAHNASVPLWTKVE